MSKTFDKPSNSDTDADVDTDVDGNFNADADVNADSDVNVDVDISMLMLILMLILISMLMSILALTTMLMLYLPPDWNSPANGRLRSTTFNRPSTTSARTASPPQVAERRTILIIFTLSATCDTSLDIKDKDVESICM